MRRRMGNNVIIVIPSYRTVARISNNPLEGVSNRVEGARCGCPAFSFI